MSSQRFQPSAVTVTEGDSPTTLSLRAAFLIYASDASQYYGHERSVYATVHAITADPENRAAPTLGPGVPAAKADLSVLAQVMAEATAFQGMIPDNLLFISPNAIAWWRPAAKRRVWFRTNDDAIGTKSADVMHPPLVFIATAKQLYAFAVARNERPTGKTKLFKAPYFNVYASGALCQGNIKMPATQDAESIPKYEAAFFRSHFTHPNDGDLVDNDGGAIALWAHLLDHPDDPFDWNAVLKPRKTDLITTLKEIAK
jgi:PRTRC genetic system protein B